MTAHYDHPLVYLLTKFVPTFVPGMFFRFHLLTYFLYLAFVSIEEMFTYSGYVIKPASLFVGAMARREDMHVLQRGVGNFGPWGILDRICGTTVAEEDERKNEKEGRNEEEEEEKEDEKKVEGSEGKGKKEEEGEQLASNGTAERKTKTRTKRSTGSASGKDITRHDYTNNNDQDVMEIKIHDRMLNTADRKRETSGGGATTAVSATAGTAAAKERIAAKNNKAGSRSNPVLLDTHDPTQAKKKNRANTATIRATIKGRDSKRTSRYDGDAHGYDYEWRPGYD